MPIQDAVSLIVESMKQIVIPELRFHRATVPTVLDYLHEAGIRYAPDVLVTGNEGISFKLEWGGNGKGHYAPVPESDDIC